MKGTIDCTATKFQFIVSMDGILIDIKYDGEDRVDSIVVPHITKDGTVIEQIGPDVFAEISKTYGKEDAKAPLTVKFEHGISKMSPCVFDRCDRPLKIIWPDTCYKIPSFMFAFKKIASIEGADNVERIERRAFCSCTIDSLKWPKNCKEIPEDCFLHADIHEITGTEAVEVIGDHAFTNTRIKKFCWPDKCGAIPNYCFSCSSLESISGIENVQTIGIGAFTETSLKSLDLSKSKVERVGGRAFAYCKSLEFVRWSTACSTIPDYCFINSSVTNFEGFEHITEIKEYAFWNTKLAEVDLTTSPVAVIERDAFPENLKRGKITMPYYSEFDELAAY